MAIPIRTQNLLKRIFPQAFQYDQRLWSGLTEQQAKSLTTIFEQLLREHYAIKSTNHDLKYYINREKYLRDLWYARHDNTGIIQDLGQVYTKAEDIAQVIDALFRAIQLIYSSPSRMDKTIEWITADMTQKFSGETTKVFHYQLQRIPALNAIEKIARSIALFSSGFIEVFRPLAHLRFINEIQAKKLMLEYTLKDEIYFIIQFYKDPDFFEKTRQKEITECLISEGLLPEEIDPEYFRLYKGGFVTFMNLDFTGADLQALQNVQNLDLLIYEFQSLYTNHYQVEKNLRIAPWHPETLGQCASSTDSTWEANQINERVEKKFTADQLKSIAKKYDPAACTLQSEELLLILFINQPLFNAYVIDHRAEVDQFCSQLGLKPSVEIQWIISKNPQVLFKDYATQAKSSSPVRMSRTTALTVNEIDNARARDREEYKAGSSLPPPY